MQATFELQHGKRGYQALLIHILNVSVTDLKRNYANLNVSFELWKGESDAQPYIPDMVQKMKDDGLPISATVLLSWMSKRRLTRKRSLHG